MPGVAMKMTTVTGTIRTAMKVLQARKSGIPWWKLWCEGNHAAYLLRKKAYRARNLEIILQKDRERKRMKKKAIAGDLNEQRRAMAKGVG